MSTADSPSDSPERDQDDAWARRVAATEINRRRVNEAIERGHRSGEAPSFVCECGRIGCTTTLTLATERYEAVRTDFDRFLVAPGHELPELEDVVERHDDYLVVTKHGRAAQMAERADARRDGA